MSATDLIEQLKTLSAGEREAFARLFHDLEKPARPNTSAGCTASSPGNWPDFATRLQRIYGDKLVADSEAVISSARGDW